MGSEISEETHKAGLLQQVFNAPQGCLQLKGVCPTTAPQDHAWTLSQGQPTPLACRGRARTERSPRRDCGGQPQMAPVKDTWETATRWIAWPWQSHPLIPAAKRERPQMSHLSVATWEGALECSRWHCPHSLGVPVLMDSSAFSGKGERREYGRSQTVPVQGFPARCQLPAPGST